MAKSAKTGQTIFLVILVAGLVFLVIRMFNTINAPKGPPPKPVANASATSSPTNATPAKTAAKPKAGVQNIAPEDKVFKDQYLNPNLFITYDMETAKNPFVQKEEWYAGIFEEHIPGYPDLKGSDYFNSMDAYLPDIGFIYDGENEWSSAHVTRSQDNSYSFSGTSDDGLINTHITLKSDIPITSSLDWSKTSQVSLETLSDPEAAKRYNKRTVTSTQDYLFDNEANGSQGSSSGGLGIPGLISPDEGYAQGDSIFCSGVSLGSGRTSALLNVNGHSTLVTDGSFIGSRFQVLEIKADGVILVELQDGSSTWIPIGEI